MARVMPMPEVAAASGSAGLQAWLVDVGQSFTAGEAIAVIETEKAVVDLEADADGVLLHLLAQPGTEVEVGDPIAILGDPGETAEAAATLLAALRPSAAPSSAVRSSAVPSSAVPSGAVTSSGQTAPAGQRVFSSPLARRLAREAGLRLEDVPGTGPGGRVVRRNVELAIANARRAGEPSPDEPSPDEPSNGAATPPTSSGTFVDQPHSRMRRAIAARLSASKQTIPHFYLRGVCRVDALLTLRTQLNEFENVKVSVNDLVLKAAALAHRRVPDMNVIWTDDAVRRFDGVDLAVAVATDGGLVTPVLRGVDRMSISGLAASTRDLAGRAKAAQLRQSELEGGSMTVTNLGMFGTSEFGAIINPPQAAILAVGAAIRTPVVTDDRIEVGTVMNVTLSVDHRPVDGVVAARWMQAFVAVMEAPLQLLI